MQPKTSERLLQGITFLSTRLPQGMAQGLFAGVASVLYGLLLLTSHRRLLVNRIQHALALPSMASHRIAHRHVRMLFESLVEVARLGDDHMSLLENRVTVAGIEHLKDAQAQGKGVIILSAHFGNWELIAPKLGALGFGITAVMQPMANPVFDAYFRRLRTSTGITIINNDRGGLRQALKTLQNNGILLLLADQHPFAPAPEILFFGHRTPIQVGPASLARTTGAKIVPAFSLRESRGRHRIVIEPALEYTLTKEKAADITQICRLYHRIYERYIRAYPDHWLWLHDRWLIDKRKA